MQKPKSRLLAATKLSDFQIKRAIEFYAHGTSPAAAARRMQVSYPTIRRVFDLVRKRMLELRLYRSYEDHFKLMEDVESQGRDWDERPLLDYLDAELGRRRGVTPATLEYHRAELIYRFDEAERVGENFSQTHFAEIVALIRMSGPLNRPIETEARAKAVVFIVQRDLDRMRIKELRLDAEMEKMYAEWDVDDPGWRDR